MEYGVCGNPALAAAAAKASLDFVEWSVGALLKPREPEEAFLAALEEARAADLPFRAVNCFVPGDLKITGPEVSVPALQGYVTTAFERAERAGVECIVFGSGGARRIPDGFDGAAAHDQLVSFCSMIAPIASDHGVTVAVEPLSRNDCNVLTSVAESAALVREVAHPSLRLLVDSYHMLRDDDPCEDIVANADLLCHVHVATVPKRLAPGAESCDLGPLFAALVEGGYDGRVSIEAKIEDPETDLPRALDVMRGLARRSFG